MGHGVHIPIKYKFLSVMLLVLFIGFGTFYFFAHKTFSENKKIDVMDLNLSAMKASNAEITLELRGRLEELQVLIPRVHRALTHPETQDPQKGPFEGISDRIKEELLGLTFARKKENGTLDIVHQYKNLE